MNWREKSNTQKKNKEEVEPRAGDTAEPKKGSSSPVTRHLPQEGGKDQITTHFKK